MAQSAFRVPLNDSPFLPTSKKPDRAERRLRQIGAWLVLYLLLQAELGLAWDRQWHDLVGRDQFWIPPHIMLYTGLGGAGIVALSVVLVESIRYFRGKPGVDDTSTISILWLFHAPLGFILLGFGALTDLLAAPLDNYWHELYGIDVTLWSPFHIMGTIGGVIAGIGSVFIFASEAVYERRNTGASRTFLGLHGPEWGAIILLAAFIELTLPALTAFPVVHLDSFRLPTYPFPLVLAGAGCIAAITRLTRKSYAGILLASVLWIEAVITQTFIPWALLSTVKQFGWSFRYANRQPAFNLTLALLPVLFLLYAILVDRLIRWQSTHNEHALDTLRWLWLPGLTAALFTVLVPAALVQGLRLIRPPLTLPLDVLLALAVGWPDLFVAFVPAALTGIGVAMLGAFLGDIWHRSDL